MLERSIKYLIFLFIFNVVHLYAMPSKDEREETKTIQRKPSQPPQRSNIDNSQETEEKVEATYLTYLTRNSFVTGATVGLVWWGERWAVDMATDVIQKTLKSSNSLLNWTVSSAIRGKSIQEALPIAQERGKLIGIEW